MSILKPSGFSPSGFSLSEFFSSEFSLLEFSLLGFFSLENFSLDYTLPERFLWESEEISMSPITYLRIFFSLTTYYILLNKLDDNNYYLF